MLSILANKHWFDITFSGMVVMAENQLITSFSVDVDHQRRFMSIRKAGPGRSSPEVQVKNDCWEDDPGESRA